MRIYFVVLLLCISTIVKSQTVPEELKKTVKEITENDTKSSEKLNHIIEWIYQNKSYDLKAFEKLNIFRSISAKQVWKNKKLLCGEYSYLLNLMCKEAGIPSISIEGYVKNEQFTGIHKMYYNDHAWNIVMTEEGPGIYDLTWAGGYIKNEMSFGDRIRKWFKRPYMLSKKKFVKEFNPAFVRIDTNAALLNHMPTNPYFQLKKESMAVACFENQYIKPIGINRNLSPDEYFRLYNQIPNQEQYIEDVKQIVVFNKKDYWTPAVNYYKYLIPYKSWIASKKGDAKSMEVMGRYNKEGLKHIQAFKKEHEKTHKEILDSLNKKKTITLKFTDNFYKTYTAKVKEHLSKKVSYDEKYKTEMEILSKMTYPDNSKEDITKIVKPIDFSEFSTIDSMNIIFNFQADTINFNRSLLMAVNNALELDSCEKAIKKLNTNLYRYSKMVNENIYNILWKLSEMANNNMELHDINFQKKKQNECDSLLKAALNISKNEIKWNRDSVDLLIQAVDSMVQLNVGYIDDAKNALMFVRSTPVDFDEVYKYERLKKIQDFTHFSKYHAEREKIKGYTYLNRFYSVLPSLEKDISSSIVGYEQGEIFVHKKTSQSENFRYYKYLDFASNIEQFFNAIQVVIGKKNIRNGR